MTKVFLGTLILDRITESNLSILFIYQSFKIRGKLHDTDFVARVFAPRAGIPEAPVTGSAYTSLAPYWVRCFEKRHLTAQQLSTRTGLIQCETVDNRVYITGNAITYLKGDIMLELS